MRGAGLYEVFAGGHPVSVCERDREREKERMRSLQETTESIHKTVTKKQDMNTDSLNDEFVAIMLLNHHKKTRVILRCVYINIAKHIVCGLLKELTS